MKHCLLSLSVVCLVALAFAPAANAAMTVNTTNDEATSGDAACSLREAIVSATSNTVGGDCARASGDNDVTVPAGHYVLSPALGELLFAASAAPVVITGADPNDPSVTNIDAAGTQAIPRRVIEVATGGKATLKNVEISGGLSASGVDGVSAGQSGTPGANGGGILNNSSGALTLDHVLVTDNFTGSGGDGANAAPDGHNAGGGNAGGAGGAIYNATNASLSITASTITGNGTGSGGDGGTGSAGVNCIGHFASGGDGGRAAYGGSGGGIYNLGNASITDSTVSENFTGAGGVGGAGGQGAGFKSCPNPPGPDIVFGGGMGGYGGDGGNGSWGPSISCTNCPFELTTLGGGGIASFGVLTMSASTISGNHTGPGGMGGPSGNPGQNQDGTFPTAQAGGDGGSAGLGGGLLVNGNANNTLTNVTIAGNFTGNGAPGGAGYSGETGLGGGRGGYGGDGGGIWSTGANNSGNTVLLKHVTVSQNGVGAGGAGGAFSETPVPGIRGKGAAIDVGGRVNPAQGAYGVGFINTLVASNGNPGLGDVNCVQHYDPSQYVDLKDLGHNISYPDNSCPGANGNPLLGSLQDNGGPTFTMLPAPGSSAIGGVPSPCPVNVDQRGLARPGPSKTSCDIGAVETGTNNPTQLSVGKLGTGAGTVTSSPGGINCGSTCSAIYEQGQVVTLTATALGGSSFTGWSGGGCSGTGNCVVTLNSDTSVTAAFADIAAPDTTITGGAADGSTISDSTPTFTFSSTESGSTFECRVDSAAFAPCSSPGPGSTGSHTTASLSDGSHTFYVRATDAATNVDASPASRTFTVDTSPPPTGDGGGGGVGTTTPPPPGPTGKRAAALKKCKKKRKGKARASCVKKAKKLPV